MFPLHLAFRGNRLRVGLRSYLSEACKASDAWDQRLSSKVFSSIKVEEFYYEMDRKFNREKRGSHVDMDIFANAVCQPSQIDSLEDLLHRFRRSPQCFKTLPSTHHAVVRAYLALNKTDQLLRILNDRLNFGIYLDPYSAVLLLHAFLSENNHRDAAKVASHLMLQEESGPEYRVARSLGALGSLHYALKDIKDQETLPWEPLPYPVKPEPEEEVKIRVEYLNPVYNDDHFDLDKAEDIIGKTLFFLGAQHEDAVVRESLLCLGSALKGDVRLPSGPVSQSISDRLRELLSEEDCSQVSFDSLDLFQYFEDAAKDELSRLDMGTKLRDLYLDWNETRESELRRQYDAYMREHRLSELERRKKALQDKEETLFFFDNVSKMDMEKEGKHLEWRKKLPPKMNIKLKPKQVVSQNYKPPKII
uniref:Mitochondrial 28S ribosomal protein S27 n=1 Tax=Caligus rogercresseyi TaxID=217165 RepID=C1BP64_CALRO|nr:Mitochondrial 28S ribosomal protein S27 [Caligus rogercresseyi]